MSAPPKLRRNAQFRSDHEHVGKISTTTTFIVVIAVSLALYEIQWILPPFVFSALLAFVCTPLIEWLAARTGLPRALFAFLVFAILMLIASAIGYLAVPPLIREFTHLLSDFQSTVTSLTQGLIGDRKLTLFGQPMDATQLAQTIIDSVRNWISQSGTLAKAGGLAFGGMFGIILTVVLLAYFLITGPAIGRGLLNLVPPQQRPFIAHIWSFLDPVLKRYFIGVFIVVAYATTAAYIGLGLFLGIPHAVVLALLTGLLEMLPVIGPAASAIIAGLVAVHYAKGIGPIIAYAIYATALRISIDQVFGPLALGTAARIHPVLVILCFLAGGFLFGVIGVILAVPVAVTVKTVLTVLYDEPLPKTMEKR